MPATDFKSGEIVTWRTQGDDSTQSIPEHRAVFFVSYEDAQTAMVSYGLRDGAPRHVKVLVSELSREQPPPLDPTYFPNGKPYSTPQPKQPLTTDQISQRLKAAREKLGGAHERAEQARQQVAAARTLADRGDGEVAKLQQELRTVKLQEVEHQRVLETALRAGHDIPVGNITVNREQLEARLKVTEATARKFSEELISSNRKLTDELDNVKAGARQLIAVLISREAEELRRQIGNVCTRYMELVSASELNLGNTQPLLLDQSTSELLSTAIIVPRDNPEARRGSAESRTRKWRELWVKLLEGEVTADF